MSLERVEHEVLILVLFCSNISVFEIFVSLVTFHDRCVCDKDFLVTEQFDLPVSQFI